MWTGTHFRELLKLSERQFYYWRRKGYINRTSSVGKRRKAFSELEVLKGLALVKVLKTKRVSLRSDAFSFLNRFEKLLDEYTKSNNVSLDFVLAGNVSLLLMFHGRKPHPWHLWYSMLLVENPMAASWVSCDKHYDAAIITLGIE